MPEPTPSSVRNRLLRRLAAPDLARLRERMELVELALKSNILEADAPVGSVYFPETGTVSMIAALGEGAHGEVGLVGPEGMVGLPLLYGVATSPLDATVQVRGVALRLSAASFRSALADTPDLLAILLRYVDAFQTQVSQTAACNGRHHIDQRLARWLLMTHDRVEGDSFPITQEFLSIMLGVRRPGVTLAVGALQRAGLVQHERGAMRILDRCSLEFGRLRVLQVRATPLRLVDGTEGVSPGDGRASPNIGQTRRVTSNRHRLKHDQRARRRRSDQECRARRRRRISVICQASRTGMPIARSFARLSSETPSDISGGSPNSTPMPA